MPKTTPVTATPVEVTLASTPTNLIQKIEGQIATVPTDELVPFYAKGKRIVDRVTDLMATVKDEMLKRLNEGAPYGKENKHRRFEIGGVTLNAECREKWSVNAEKAMDLLRSKKLIDDATDLVIESGVDELQKFLRKNRREVAKMGLVTREVLNEDKLQALVMAKKITIKEFEGLLDKGDPTYTFKVPNKKE